MPCHCIFLSLHYSRKGSAAVNINSVLPKSWILSKLLILDPLMFALDLITNDFHLTLALALEQYWNFYTKNIYKCSIIIIMYFKSAMNLNQTKH